MGATARCPADSPILVLCPLDELFLDPWPFVLQKIVDCVFRVFVLARCLKSFESTEIPGASVLERWNGKLWEQFLGRERPFGRGMLYKLCRRCRHGGGRRGSCHVAAEQLYSQSSLWASSASLQDWKIVTGSSDQSPTPRK